MTTKGNSTPHSNTEARRPPGTSSHLRNRGSYLPSR